MYASEDPPPELNTVLELRYVRELGHGLELRKGFGTDFVREVFDMCSRVGKFTSICPENSRVQVIVYRKFNCLYICVQTGSTHVSGIVNMINGVNEGQFGHVN